MRDPTAAELLLEDQDLSLASEVRRLETEEHIRRAWNRNWKFNKRLEAHHWFDKIWQKGLMTRDEAYAWLAQHMPKRHIANMLPNECNHLVRLVRQHFPDLFPTDESRKAG